MDNSSFIYSVNEESADLAIPYMESAGKLRRVDWQSWVNLGADMGPAGHNSELSLTLKILNRSNLLFQLIHQI